MKCYSTLLCLLFSISVSFSQKTAKIVFNSNKDMPEGFYLNLKMQNHDFKSEEAYLELNVMIEQPEYGYLVSPKGKTYMFWYEEGTTEMTFEQGLFKNELVVKGSDSHNIYERLKGASDFNEFKKIFDSNKNSFVALDYVNRFYKFLDFSKEEFKEIYQLISSDNYELIPDFTSYITVIDKNKLTENEKFIDFIGYDKDGKTYNSSDYRGQYLLVDVAATWCGPCWSAFSYMIENLKKYDNIQFITLNQDDDIVGWQEKAKKKDLNITWPVIWEVEGGKKDLFHQYQITGYPTYILVDPSGTVVERWDFSNELYFKKTMKKYLD